MENLETGSNVTDSATLLLLRTGSLNVSAALLKAWRGRSPKELSADLQMRGRWSNS